MKQSEALEHLQGYMIALQKYRSIVAEDISDLDDNTKASMWPWVFGDKCPLEALSKIIDGVDNGGQLAPLNYYNMMYILYNFSPEILAVIRLAGNEMPEREPSVLTIQAGWEEE